MRKTSKNYNNLAYLEMKPKVIRWVHITGPKLDPIQMYDVIYDDYDLKIRQLPKDMLNGRR